jgi:hypothetical protein
MEAQSSQAHREAQSKILHLQSGKVAGVDSELPGQEQQRQPARDLGDVARLVAIERELETNFGEGKSPLWKMQTS